MVILSSHCNSGEFCNFSLQGLLIAVLIQNERIRGGIKQHVQLMKVFATRMVTGVGVCLVPG